MSTIWLGSRRFDAAAVNRRIAQAMNAYRSLGLGPGDGVGLCLRNDIAFFEAGLGAGRIGCYTVAMNWHYTEEEARYLLTDSGVRALVVHADLLPAIRAAIAPHVILLVVPTPAELRADYGVSEAEGRVPDGMIDWSAWLAGFEPSAEPPAEIPTTIIYTSGTTGRPKGVRRPTFSPSEAAGFAAMLNRSYGYLDDLGDPSRIVTAVVGPIYHSAPNAHANHSFRLGANIVVMPRFDAEGLLQLIERHRITHLNMVPIMFNRLLKLPADVRAKYDLSSLRHVAHAAAPCAPAVKHAMIEWWGPVIFEYYGSTEMGNVAMCTSAQWLAHPGTVGRVTPEARVRIIDAEGRDMPVGQPGEVIARIPAIGDFTYHGDDAKRRGAEKQGLFTPGDIGYFTDDGFLFLCDRKTDMVISGGVNIYPAEIEAELHRLAEVADCAVFGIPDTEFGEVLHAVVQLQPGRHLTEAEVKAALRKVLAGYKVPKQVEFRDALPREDSGKIFKRKLRQAFWQDAGRSI
jgi:long-chain acyl-CoA synthetase